MFLFGGKDEFELILLLEMGAEAPSALQTPQTPPPKSGTPVTAALPEERPHWLFFSKSHSIHQNLPHLTQRLLDGSTPPRQRRGTGGKPGRGGGTVRRRPALEGLVGETQPQAQCSGSVSGVKLKGFGVFSALLPARRCKATGCLAARLPACTPTMA